MKNLKTFLSIGLVSLLAQGAFASGGLGFTAQDNQVKNKPLPPTLSPQEATAQLNDVPLEPPQQPQDLNPQVKPQVNPQPAVVANKPVNNRIATVLPQKKGFEQKRNLAVINKKKKKTKSSHALAVRQRPMPVRHAAAKTMPPRMVSTRAPASF